MDGLPFNCPFNGALEPQPEFLGGCKAPPQCDIGVLDRPRNLMDHLRGAAFAVRNGLQSSADVQALRKMSFGNAVDFDLEVVIRIWISPRAGFRHLLLLPS